MTYTVKYRRIGRLFWKSIKNVVKDGYAQNHGSEILYVVTLKDGTVIEIPAKEYIFKVSSEKWKKTKSEMEKEAGSPLPIEENYESFSVKIKRKNSFFTKTIRDLRGDETVCSYRIFYLKDNSIIEYPQNLFIFQFSPERDRIIKKRELEKQLACRI